MPIIPLPKVSMTADAAAPVLDTQRRPTVDNSAQQRGVSMVADSLKMPLMNPDALSAPYDALGSVGRALAQGGGVLGALAIKKAEAQTDIDTADAQGQMMMAQAKFEAFKQSDQDPSSWQDKAQKTVEETRSAILANPKLSQASRDRITLHAKQWESQVLTGTLADSAKKTFGLAADAKEAAVYTAINSQDPVAFKQAVQEGRAKGYFFDSKVAHFEQAYKDEGDRQKLKAQADAMDTAQNAVISYASNKSEDDALKELDAGTFGKFAPTDQERLRGIIQQTAKNRSAQSIGSIIDGIYSTDPQNQITSAARIDELAHNDPHMTPQLVAQAKEMLARRSDAVTTAQMEEDMQKNGVPNFVKLGQAIDAYDPAQDKDRTQFAYLTEAIASRVPTELRKTLTAQLDKKDGREAPEVRTQIQKTLDEVFDPRTGIMPYETKQFKTQKYVADTTEGRFNPFAPTVTHKAGDPIIDPKTGQPKLYPRDVHGEQPFQWVPDVNKAGATAAARAEVMQKILTWQKQNPDKANDPEAVQKALYERLPDGTRKAAMGIFAGEGKASPQANAGASGASGAVVTSYGYKGDSTPDSNSSAGIGAFTTEADAKGPANAPTRLQAGDIAVSPDVEAKFRAAGIKPGDQVMYKLADGTTKTGRWMDRTAQDAEILAGKVPKVSKPLRGRFDIYSPDGSNPLNGMQVQQFAPVKKTDTTSEKRVAAVTEPRVYLR